MNVYDKLSSTQKAEIVYHILDKAKDSIVGGVDVEICDTCDCLEINAFGTNRQFSYCYECDLGCCTDCTDEYFKKYFERLDQNSSYSGNCCCNDCFK